ncbi:DNA alkylation repair protein [Polaribacter porphyrae]|uniref:DNA alkylation repair protein n=1 Tax=Polaribacter porphyrae TaxID=1137780 RepID=A0A2S7WQ58_9FLAO|nr:DNA alkylation repair protein [Polaribacter porphyrae]PQJ79452.1 hypothetical protein BTO18_09840 [Polaribacter porphyrae]
MRFEEIISKLKQLENLENVLYRKQKFGIESTNALGITHKDLNAIAKEIGKNNELAIQLFDSGIYEGRLLCSKVFNPKDVTEDLIEKWVVTFENWEICDSFAMKLFSRSKFALAKILDWCNRENEFEKRAAFAIMASYCMFDKKSENELFIQFLPIIKEASTDDRLYVKKAVNWALRNIGKRNIDLNKEAIKQANEIVKLPSNSAKWIANDALRELQKDGVRISDYPRNIYRK